jgi:hypothetical protein
MSYYWEKDKDRLPNVYVDLFSSNDDTQAKGEEIAAKIESKSISSKAGELTIVSTLENKILYKEIIVTASREYPILVDLSFIGFPETITVTTTSTTVVQNANEFIRNIDIADDFMQFIVEKYNLHDIKDTISSFGSKVTSYLGW